MALNEEFCRVLLISSLALDTLNQVTLELSTPPYVEPDGILFCFMSQLPFLLESNTTYVASLEKGGTQFEISEVNVTGISGPSNAAKAVNDWNLTAVEICALPDLLSTDPYYSHSYSFRRYDDFVTDGPGNSLGGLFVEDDPAKSAAGRRHGNCMLVTAPWEANTRYEIVLSAKNPRPSAGPGNGALKLWMAPFSYSRLEYEQLGFKLRGPRYGTVCSTREGAGGQGSLEPEFFDACTAAGGESLPLPENAIPMECVDALNRNLAANPNLSGRSPYNRHPLSAPRDLPTADTRTLSCASTQAASPRNGGECISCTPHGSASKDGLSCSCPSNHSAFVVGLQACGPPLAENATDITSASKLARKLCSDYTMSMEDLHQGELSDRLVNAAYLSAFASQARLLMDGSTVFEANRSSFGGDLAFDERQPDSPSRRTGVKPKCNLCNADGNFTNFKGGIEGHVFDQRFLAANTLRAIGVALDMADFPCPTLFDSSDPDRPFYGPYEDRMCQDLETTTNTQNEF